MNINYLDLAHTVFQFISFYFLCYSFYWMMTLFIGSFYKEPETSSFPMKDRWLVVLPAYAPNSTFFEVLKSIRDHQPPNFVEMKTYVLFQNTNAKFIDQCYKKMDFLCNHKSFHNQEGNSYVHALKFICHQITSDNHLKLFDPTHIILLDKDNIIAPDFFYKMYALRGNGYDLIQGKRLPLSHVNGVTSYDQISESLNDMMMRQYRVKMGWLPELSGSGFLVDKRLFVKGINKLDENNPGMDKNLLINWLLNFNDIKACFSNSTLVYEEKTDDIKVLGAQRTRWFAEQYQTLAAYFTPLVVKGITSFRFEILDYVFALSRPPRSIHLLVVPTLLTLELALFQTSIFNLLSLLFLVFGLILFLTNQRLWGAAFQVLKMFPSLILSNLKSILKIGSQTKGNFIHTEREEK
ncbi:glycosyltransferase family 2 protein [Flammeovirga sp. EKP202]|uniref:glycosyltransferase n=1 Tax=Flammeovirga sp. EKP202 TaxID=2770592 RepID=UPI00165F0796|nr:glycosyltransferase family 2 protein [Flammeovirga sp. EKP202]MBD0401381.1 glycosyltransferase [Flammeovirga sp. EKP202]